MSNESLVKLNGTILHPDGTTTITSKFDFLRLRPDDYSDIAFSPAEAEHIRRRLTHLSTGASAATPLMCGGRARCPFQHNCPIVKMDDLRLAEDPDAPSIIPVGRPCIVEVSLLDHWTQKYLEQFDVDTDNMVDISFCQELAEIELYLWRLNNNLSKPQHAELVQEVTVGIDRDGNALTHLETNAFYDARERMLNRKTKITKLMVADRESKLREKIGLKLKGSDSLSAEAAKLHAALVRASTQATSALPANTADHLISEVVEAGVEDDG